MARIFECNNWYGKNYGLYKREHDELPFVVTINHVMCAECDTLGEANRIYNSVMRNQYRKVSFA